MKRTMDKEYEEIQVRLNEKGKECVKVFKGSLLSQKQVNKDGFEVIYRLYETPRGKLACVVWKNLAWQSSAKFEDEKWEEISQDPQWWKPQCQLYVANNDEELEKQIGAELTQSLRNGETPLEVEYLDI